MLGLVCRPASAEEVGRASFELSWLLEEKQDAVKHAVRVEDDKGDKLGSLLVTVKDYETLEGIVGGGGRRG